MNKKSIIIRWWIKIKIKKRGKNIHTSIQVSLLKTEALIEAKSEVDMTRPSKLKTSSRESTLKKNKKKFMLKKVKKEDRMNDKSWMLSKSKFL